VKASNQAGVIGNLNIPIYDGGMASAQVRQSKEVLSQARMVLDRVRMQTAAAVVAT
jgi:outer membrane protein